uniref:Homeobox domain-containing protein n=1 Tax=Daphnia galeata TaxID=27404 RepID=A0A8J2RXQ8_9CRUS|nr:unnamed protein product [Daphnia galeata]
MPVRSFNIEDLLDYGNNDDFTSKSTFTREKDSGKTQPEETDVTVIDVENLKEPETTHKNEINISVDRKNKKERIHNSEVPLPIYIRADAKFCGSWPPKRRIRTVFTVGQINQLEKRFQTQHYLTAGERIDLARHLNLSVLQVCNIMFIKRKYR